MKKFIILLGIALVYVASATGQKRPVELNLEQAIEIALDENLTIKIADMEV